MIGVAGTLARCGRSFGKAQLLQLPSCGSCVMIGSMPGCSMALQAPQSPASRCGCGAGMAQLLQPSSGVGGKTIVSGCSTEEVLQGVAKATCGIKNVPKARAATSASFFMTFPSNRTREGYPNHTTAR